MSTPTILTIPKPNLPKSWLRNNWQVLKVSLRQNSGVGAKATEERVPAARQAASQYHRMYYMHYCRKKTQQRARLLVRVVLLERAVLRSGVDDQPLRRRRSRLHPLPPGHHVLVARHLQGVVRLVKYFQAPAPLQPACKSNGRWRLEKETNNRRQFRQVCFRAKTKGLLHITVVSHCCATLIRVEIRYSHGSLFLSCKGQTASGYGCCCCCCCCCYAADNVGKEATEAFGGSTASATNERIAQKC